MEFRDGQGNGILTGELPEGFRTSASAEIVQYPVSQHLKVRFSADRGNCGVRYQTGESYLYEKKKLPNPFGFAQEQGPQNDSGFWYAVPRSLREDLDSMAASILGRQARGEAYYDLSDELRKKAEAEFQRQIGEFMEELRASMSIASMPVCNVMRNYLLDGGLGVYGDGDRFLAVCFYRVGVEMDTMLGQGIYENVTGEPFGQADCSGVDISSATWNVPFVLWMSSDDREDLKTFLRFADTVELTDGMKAYRDQLAIQVRQFQMQKARMDNMQTQAMISTMFAQQQQQFAAMDRLSSQMSRDMDQWRAGQTQMRQQADARFAPSYSGSESIDDRIQRLRHESIMGVETYDRNDGTTVEFDNRAERVFENNLDDITHFGTHNYFDSYVPEGWHELKPKD